MSKESRNRKDCDKSEENKETEWVPIINNTDDDDVMIEFLPEEVLINIFSLLDPTTLNKSCLVCKRLVSFY